VQRHPHPRPLPLGPYRRDRLVANLITLTCARDAAAPGTSTLGLAGELGLWFRVDAAYGGALAFSPTHRYLLRGIERARTVTFDPHKWMFVPPELRAATPELQDAVQTRLQQRIERTGRAWLATTVLSSRRALRCNINSFLTRPHHIDALLTLLHTEAPRAAAEALSNTCSSQC
jgi:glutamate/tyrosine decarboxylase-like PLP-dependent enzyme